MKLMQYAAEAIDFQSVAMADQVTDLFTKIMKSKNAKEAQSCDAAVKLRKLFEQQTNLKLNINFDNPYPPCMMPIHINPNTILGDDVCKSYYLKDSNKIMGEIETTTQSYVDLKNAKVGGVFAVVSTDIYMGFEVLRQLTLTPRELASVLMHEVGHAFVAYELAFNTIQTNQILLSLHKSLINNDQKLFEYSLKMVETKVGVQTGVYQELKNETNSKVVTTVVLAHMQEKRKSELGTAAYDKTTYEALADNYAVRMGLGRELVTGLEKINRLYGSPEYNSSTRFSISSAELVISTFLMGAGFATGTVPMMLLGMALYFLISWGASDGNDHQHTYDKIKIRYKRVREQLVNRLKEKSLPKDIVKKTLEDLAAIDKIVERAGEFTSIMGLVGNIIYPSNWGLIDRMKAQRKIEELAANDLFVKAAQLRSI